MNSADTPRLHFNRFEFKYLLPADTMSEIVKEIKLRLEPDIHSDADGGYFIRSHYFDTDEFDLFYEKLAGLRKRYKFRLRNYSNKSTYANPLFLELKGRDDALVYKHRIILGADMVEESLRTGTVGFAEYLLEQKEISRVEERFVFDVFKMKLSPSVVVDYHRAAFESRANPDFRATIDINVKAYRALSDGHPAGNPISISPNLQILEIKFRYRLPMWFHRLIQIHQLRRVSFSKFAYATNLVYMNSYDSHLNRIIERSPACLR